MDGWNGPTSRRRPRCASRHSSASLISGFVSSERELVLESRMPSGGVIFSDGVEEDFLAFNAGATAHILPAAQRARLVVS